MAARRRNAGTPDRRPEEDTGLVHDALAVLDGNWLGHATQPSPSLYPHQWSWDSAFIAMAYAHTDAERAETELRSLFRGQWSNGFLPHIVFRDGASYFPGPEFWQTERSPHAPESPQTSGAVQPPIHATAVWHVYRVAPHRRRAARFLEELLPRLAAWHGYLYRERTRGDDALVEVWHPWESGMDNSPLWDDALARLSFAREEVPAYRRVDVDVAERSERPSDAEYDRYAYLVQLFRSLDYRPPAIRAAAPFAIRPVLFNSILVQANRDLAEIARVTGSDPEPFEAWADQTAAGLETLWDEEDAVYVDYDVVSGERVRARSVSGYATLYAGVPADARAKRMAERLEASGVHIDGRGFAVTSLSPDDPRFDPDLYWRGPIWPVLTWVVCRGLDRYGFSVLAERLRATQIDLVRRGGFREHYSPVTGRGHGGEQFAWTAAIVLDLLRDRPGQKATKGEE